MCVLIFPQINLSISGKISSYAEDSFQTVIHKNTLRASAVSGSSRASCTKHASFLSEGLKKKNGGDKPHQCSPRLHEERWNTNTQDKLPAPDSPEEDVCFSDSFLGWLVIAAHKMYQEARQNYAGVIFSVMSVDCDHTRCKTKSY